MKIEKINNNQIRCTLTTDDLVQLDMKMSELAYGSEKARMLFRDMMTRARNEYGFEAENVPLMIEAIPGSSDTLVLVITKVDDPEELDTRFSRFSPTLEDGHAPVDLSASGADDVIGLYKKAEEALRAIQKAKESTSGGIPSAGEAAQNGDSSRALPPIDLIRLYTFDDLDTIIRVTGILGETYNGDNTLYRSRSNGSYMLSVHKSDLTPEVFNRVCNILSEYGRVSECTPALEAHLTEHEEIILRHTALQSLRDFA